MNRRLDIIEVGAKERSRLYPFHWYYNLMQTLYAASIRHSDHFWSFGMAVASILAI